MYKIKVEVNKDYVAVVEKFLDEKSIKYERVVRKALDFPELIVITTELLMVIKWLYDLFTERKNKNEDIRININANDININFVEIRPEEIDRKIREVETKQEK